MITIEEHFNKDVAKECLTILSYCDNTFLNNIPNYVLKKLNDLAADSYQNFYVNKNKTLVEQNISDDCKNLIAILYFTYMPDSETKKELLNTWLINEKNENY